jgi:hypothetical protein
MAMITINGVALPNPSVGGYTVTRRDLDSENTTRNTKGILMRDRIRAGVYEINCAWDILTPSQKNVIENAIYPAKLQVSFFDSTSGTTVTRSMYASDRTAQLVRYLDESKPQQALWSYAFSLIEF